jgi:hypothetical protein
MRSFLFRKKYMLLNREDIKGGMYMTEFLVTYYILCGCLFTVMMYTIDEVNFMEGFHKCKANGKLTLALYLCLVIVSWPIWVVKFIIKMFLSSIR